MSSHTLGPWFAGVERSECDGVNITFGVTSQARVGICSGQSQEHMNGILEDECRANARLIAAAPELLAALQTIVAIDDGDNTSLWAFNAEFDAARAAIIKATGVTP